MKRFASVNNLIVRIDNIVFRRLLPVVRLSALCLLIGCLLLIDLAEDLIAHIRAFFGLLLDPCGIGAFQRLAKSRNGRFNLGLIARVNLAAEILQRLFRVSEDDVVIGISFPRYSKHTNIAMEYASGKGATTIAVTDSMHSPIAKNARHVLTAGSGMVSFADSLAAPLSLINALIAAVSLEKEAEIGRSFETLEHLWDEYDVYEKTDR